MKTELSRFSNDLLDQYRVLFVYGNFPELADVLLYSFIDYKKQSKFAYKCMTLSASDFLKQQEFVQETLFESGIHIYRITNVFDSNVEKFLEKAAINSNTVFIVTPGDFKKSKKASDTICADNRYLSLPSFKNEFTYISLSKHFFKNASSNDIKNIASILEKDPSPSAILKLTLLYESDPLAINSYTVESNNWIFDMQPIPLLRFLSACQAKGSLEKVLEPMLKAPASLPDFSEYFLNTEIRIKSGECISNESIICHMLAQNTIKPRLFV